VSTATAPSDVAVDEGGAWQNGVAEDGWWTAERAKFLGERLAPFVPRSGLAFDLGCGRGETVDLLAESGAGYVVGVDYEAQPSWQPRRGRVGYVVCDAHHLPFRPGVADLVVSFDVIEHFADDAAPLGAARQMVRDGGAVALTVPANPSLWSPFDDRVGHHRRYTRDTLEAATTAAQLVPQDTTYFYAWLVPAMWLTRRRDRAQSDAVSSGLLGRTVAAVIAGICHFERWLLRRHDLPFGSSLFMRCRPGPAADDVP
jgi:SAM-dependent methyltransferase